MRHFIAVVCLVPSLVITPFAQQAASVAKSPAKPAGLTAEATSGVAARLPVKRVVLYKNGVGYFEHVGHVRGSQDVNVDFTTGQLNDVLKSLAVVDMGGGHINSVRYNSVAPLSERLKTLRLGIDGETSSYQFLNSLRGAKVEVRSGAATLIGSVLSVERKQQRKDNVVTEVDQLTVVSSAGDMRVFDLGPGTSVRILEQDLAKEVGRYMDLVSSTRERDLRRMTIATDGSGDRSLFVSYISEVPVWKSTYRIILPSKKDASPIIQGWAIIDNTIGEDWKDVELSLVAGAPQSFIQNLSQPYYTQRPVIGLPKTVQLTPQTHEATYFDRMRQMSALQAAAPPPAAGEAGDVVASEQISALPVTGANAYSSNDSFGGGVGGGIFKRGDISMGLSGTVVDSSGAVVANTRITVTDAATGGVVGQSVTDSAGRFAVPTSAGTFTLQASAPGFNPWSSRAMVSPGQVRQLNIPLSVGASSMAIEVRDEASPEDEEVEASEAAPLAEMFEYKLKQKVSVGKNQSALVPIISGKIDAEKVTLWNAKQPAPVRALWINNTSGLTLDAGTFNIIEQGTFGGEGVWTVMKPEEKRLISYAAEDAIRVKSEDKSEEGGITHVKIVHGVMTQTQQREQTTTYTVRNEDSLPRVVVIEHPARADWKLRGDTKPAESTENYHRFRVEVEPKSTAELKVDEGQDSNYTWALTNLSDDVVNVFLKRKSITPELERELRKLVAQKTKIDGIVNEIGTRTNDINRITQEQNRLRENMKALRGSAEEKQLTQRYVRQLNQQEDDLERLKKELSDLNTQRMAEQATLAKMADEVSFDKDI
jgi:hypothetical protein